MTDTTRQGCEARGGRKMAAAAPELSYSLQGKLYLSASGWLLMDVPNALGHGAFQALNEPGTEVPKQDSGNYRAHVSVMRKEEIDEIGGGDKITERGKSFGYTLGPVRAVSPHGWDDVSKCWMIEIHSPELEKLRKSYGLSGLPKNGEFKFHSTFAIRKKRVLQAGNVKKGSLIHNPGRFLSTDPIHENIPVFGKSGSSFYDTNASESTSYAADSQSGDASKAQTGNQVLDAIRDWRSYRDPRYKVGGFGSDQAATGEAVTSATSKAGGAAVPGVVAAATVDPATSARGSAVDRLATATEAHVQRPEVHRSVLDNDGGRAAGGATKSGSAGGAAGARVPVVPFAVPAGAATVSRTAAVAHAASNAGAVARTKTATWSVTCSRSDSRSDLEHADHGRGAGPAAGPNATTKRAGTTEFPGGSRPSGGASSRSGTAGQDGLHVPGDNGRSGGTRVGAGTDGFLVKQASPVAQLLSRII